MVKVSKLTVRYAGVDAPALRDVDIEVRPGERVLVTGPSGCGKSTLALCLAGFIPHAVHADTAGSVVVAGADVGRASVYDLARVVGLVQQDPEAQFCTMTVEDEVAFGPENLACERAEIARRVDEALRAAGCAHLRGRRLSELSGGEKQRVALAAVLAMGPRLLILDEPSAHLDPRGTGELVRLLHRMSSDARAALIILEHRPARFLRVADRLVQLEDGAVVFDGPARDSPRAAADALDGLPPRRRWSDRVGRPLLEVRGLTQAYLGRAVLRDVSLAVGRGEIVGLMGDNGSGKTTLLLSVMGILRPASGEVFIEGEDVTDLPVSARARRIGMVLQNPNHQLFSDRVWREVVIGPMTRGAAEAACRPAADELLRRFGLEAFSEVHPLSLSFGQKRRLNLASVMATDPSVLLLDEPLVGQDAARAADLLGLLGEMACAGKGVLIVGHDPDVMAAFCDRLVFLDAGRVVVDAPCDEALAELERRGLHDYLPSNRA